MDKTERKTLLRDLADKRAKEEALASKRYIYDDIRWRGIGVKVLQIFYRSSFENNKIWDIRKQDKKYVLFESHISETERNIIEPGYAEMDIESDRLQAIVSKFNGLKLPLGIPESNHFGLDGTTYEIILFGLQKSIGIKWWEDPHEDWHELSSLTKLSIDTFLKLQRRENDR